MASRKKNKKKQSRVKSPITTQAVETRSPSPSTQSAPEQLSLEGELDVHSSHGQSATTDKPKRSPLYILLLVCFFIVQIWGALSYYQSENPWDERFSWRMFSTVRGLKCTFELFERRVDGTETCPDDSRFRCSSVHLSSRHHMVWVNLLARGRLSVLDRLAEHECAKQQGEPGFYARIRCPDPTPPHQPHLLQSPEINLCLTPRLRQRVQGEGQRL